jgi:hypothetical protein
MSTKPFSKVFTFVKLFKLSHTILIVLSFEIILMKI